MVREVMAERVGSDKLEVGKEQYVCGVKSLFLQSNTVIILYGLH